MNRQSVTPRWWFRGLVPGVLIAIGVLHTLVGLVIGWDVLSAVVREGFWDTVHSDPGPIGRPLLMWFLLAGFVLMMLGHLAWWVERHARRPLPAALGVELILFALVFGAVQGAPVQALFFVAVGAYIVGVAAASKKPVEKTSA